MSEPTASVTSRSSEVDDSSGLSDDDRATPTRVAIACQGGGSHTAFAAGVLRTWLSDRAWDEEFELVGISGTSGGAFNALAAWYGLLSADEPTAADLLESVWNDFAADEYPDRLFNEWVAAFSRLESTGAAVPQVSPYYSPVSELGKAQLSRILERHVDFASIPDLTGAGTPELVVGTVDVRGGEFETFTNEDVTIDAVLASAALPMLFEAVEIDGTAHWDGLFSQNPPIKDLVSGPVERTPEELWVIQINPQTREDTPTTPFEIADRRNELAGNLSLNQELAVVERINRWIAEGHLDHPQYTTTTIRRIELQGYHHASKLDRDPEFIDELLRHGENRGREFLEGLELETDVTYPART
ncbi:patatin-like phospholipase family protein [Natrinema ejinorense]|uniref:Patatin n=1 Tax=Natrinema ejinorense TaxID=373386 RepID=A0A2A5QTK3_9EURY|nr:patatin-like phospholipase family protein [Natrinema ejinorense]PCR90168.1 patatin [Natrinema ejinorense]